MKTKIAGYREKPNYIDVSFFEFSNTLYYTHLYFISIKTSSDIGRWHIKYKNNETNI